MDHADKAVHPIFSQHRHLQRAERLAIFDDALAHRQRIEAMDWYPVIETLDEYQARVWHELEL